MAFWKKPGESGPNPLSGLETLGSVLPGSRDDTLSGTVSVPRGRLAPLSRRMRLLIIFPALAAAGGLAALGSLLVYYTLTFPDPMSVRQKTASPVVRILARDGSVLAERGGTHDYMPVDLLPPVVTGAIVATEDRRFFEHWGIDPVGLVRATFANLRAGRFAQGGSTLTQQLAKNMFLTHDRTLSRKIDEVVLAFWLELRLSKSDILELYVNRVYFGGGAYGIEAAAQRYFDKSARELTIAEAAVIAGLLKAPSKYAPTASREQALRRGRSVLAKMRDASVITALQEQRAAQTPVRFVDNKRKDDITGYEYAIDHVLENLPSFLGADHAELIVETTIDAALQRQAAHVVRGELERAGDAQGASQAAVAVLDTDGGIRALTGGRSYAQSQFNRAVKARRQPGSAFKPFVYLAAVERGYSPDSITYDLPVSYAGWSPRNENGRHLGAVTLRQALAQSINSVAVRLGFEAGLGQVATVAHRLGIRSELRQEPSLPLGTSEVSLLELTGAYGAFANGGQAIEPHIIRRVRMSSGRVLFARTAPLGEQVVAPAYVAMMNDMMRATLVWGTGKRAEMGWHPAAGKTGTSQEFRDAWFVGYTAHLTAGVWVGNDNGRAMNKVKGGQLPADIWRQVMLAAHEGKAPIALPGVPAAHAPAPAAAPLTTSALGTPAAAGMENLPWLEQAAANAMPMLPPGGKPSTAAEKVRAHPEGGISADFIARALEGAAGLKPAEGRKANPATPASQAAGGRIVVRPPPAGMMSLGAPLQ